jgi:hypothetical protein
MLNFAESDEENVNEDGDESEDGVLENCPTDTVPYNLNHNCLSPIVMKIKKVIRIFRDSQNMISIYKSILCRIWQRNGLAIRFQESLNGLLSML